ncbi:hypothetical protein C8R45DRAFT_1130684 [Mycena sanguinolenta]|nr:hypothetical protein C8R45DRAFT_1130684 [Mycena sanguinolenta]
MLLILVAVHLLSQDSIAAPLSHPPNTRATTDSCNDTNDCRTLFSVVWGLHMGFGAPECAPAQSERSSAFLAKAENDAHRNYRPGNYDRICCSPVFCVPEVVEPIEYEISKTHGFFVGMGGFVSPDGHLIATLKQLGDPDRGSKLQDAIRNVNEEEVKDKSKGDALSEGVALLQGLWFILLCLARAHQRLAVTQLEVATLAFAVVNIFIWLLWWNKPLDVQWPIVVGPPTQPDTETMTPPVQLSRFEQFFKAIGGYGKEDYHPLSSVSVPSFWSIEIDDEIEAYALLTLVGTVFGAIHCAAWNAIFPTPAEMWIWRTSSLVIAAIPGLILLLGKIIESIDAYWGNQYW